MTRSTRKHCLIFLWRQKPLPTKSRHSIQQDPGRVTRRSPPSYTHRSSASTPPSPNLAWPTARTSAQTALTGGQVQLQEPGASSPTSPRSERRSRHLHFCLTCEKAATGVQAGSAGLVQSRTASSCLQSSGALAPGPGPRHSEDTGQSQRVPHPEL